jgi:hypothetical protein
MANRPDLWDKVELVSFAEFKAQGTVPPCPREQSGKFDRYRFLSSFSKSLINIVAAFADKPLI